jgi:hypothetical protein
VAAGTVVGLLDGASVRDAVGREVRGDDGMLLGDQDEGVGVSLNGEAPVGPGVGVVEIVEGTSIQVEPVEPAQSTSQVSLLWLQYEGVAPHVMLSHEQHIFTDVRISVGAIVGLSIGSVVGLWVRNVAGLSIGAGVSFSMPNWR